MLKNIAFIINVFLLGANLSLEGQEYKIIPHDRDNFDFFGYSIDFNNDNLIVGAPNHGENYRGAAYLYKRIKNNEWNFVQKILPPEDFENLIEFGTSVAILGDYLFIGGIDSYDFLERSGTVHIYKKEGNLWEKHSIIFPPNPEKDYSFGRVLSVSKDFLIVGAPRTIIDNTTTGAVFLYQIKDDKWNFVKKIIPSNLETSRDFGESVFIYNNILAIGDTRGITSLGRTGKVFIYKCENNDWIKVNEIFPLNGAPGDNFGKSVMISGNNLVIGTRWNQCRDVISRSGSVYYYNYDYDTNNWNENQVICPNNEEYELGGIQFGASMFLNREKLVIGSPGTIHEPIVHYCELKNKTVLNEMKLMPSEDATPTSFGKSLYVNDDFILVGAPSDEENGIDSGAVYVFEQDFNSRKLINIFPNPNNGVFTILLNLENLGNKDEMIEITIFDSIGRLHYHKKTNNSDIDVKLPYVSNGVYFVSIKYSDLVETRKIIITNL